MRDEQSKFVHYRPDCKEWQRHEGNEETNCCAYQTPSKTQQPGHSRHPMSTITTYSRNLDSPFPSRKGKPCLLFIWVFAWSQRDVVTSNCVVESWKWISGRSILCISLWIIVVTPGPTELGEISPKILLRRWSHRCRDEGSKQVYNGPLGKHKQILSDSFRYAKHFDTFWQVSIFESIFSCL